MTRRYATLVTAPATEPVTLDEVKAFCRIDSTSEDGMLSSFIAAAREYAENFTRRKFITQTWKLTLDLGCGGLNNVLGEGVYDLPVTALYGALPRVIELWPGPVQSVTSIKTYDLNGTESTFDPANYALTDSRLVLGYGVSWPVGLRPEAACVITFATGYGNTSSSVPQAIRTSILSHVMKMYDERGVCDMPDANERLLRAYRVMDGLAHG